MHRRQKLCVKGVRKDVWSAAFRQVSVKPLHARQAATDDDDLRIENVDDTGQGAAEAGLKAAQRSFAGRVAGTSAMIDDIAAQVLAGMAEMVSTQRRT